MMREDWEERRRRDGLRWTLERVGGGGEVYDCCSRGVSGGEERVSGIVGKFVWEQRCVWWEWKQFFFLFFGVALFALLVGETERK